MSRDDRLRRQLVVGDPRVAAAVDLVAPPSSSSASGCGWVTSSSSSIRSSYSMPSAFICATASPRALNCCADSTCRGSSSVDSMTETTSRAYVGDSRSSSSIAASANGDSGWLSAKSACRSTVSRTRPALARRARRAARRRRRRAARGRSRSPAGCAAAGAGRSSWLSVSRCASRRTRRRAGR